MEQTQTQPVEQEQTELSLGRKILYGFGGYLGTMLILQLICGAGAMFGIYLIEHGASGLGMTMIFLFIGFAYWAAYEFRIRRAFPSTKAWCTAGMVLFGLRIAIDMLVGVSG